MSKKLFCLFVITLGMFSILSCKQEQSTEVTEVEFQPIISNFDSSDEGWKISGNGPSAFPDFFSLGGSSGGYISDNDEVIGDWFFTAPQKCLGDASGAYGKYFELWLKQTQAQSDDHRDDIKITGSGIAMYYNFSQNPDTVWTKYRVNLDETGGWVNYWNNAIKQEDIKNILKDLTEIKIRGDYYTWTDNDTVSIDNIQFGVE